MKRSTKKGFTIVELVIVIAIIAILAAVLIPTFASLIQKANVSKDTQLVKNLNTALAANGKEHKTMTEALAAAAEFGYDVGKINASATGNEILWDSENDVFCYHKDGKVEYIPETSLKNGKPADYKLWKVYNAGEKVPEQQKYSIYWNRTDDFTATLTVGFDAGKCTAITTLKYERTGETVTPQEVVIRTSSGETSLTVNADKDTVMHYGAAGEVNVLAVDKTHSYHEFGSVYTLKAKSGHIVLESGSLVYDLQKDASAAADLSFVSNGTVVKAAGIEGVTVSETYDIYNLEQLCAFRDHVNAGMTFESLVIEIKADIDMSSVSWMPIGTMQHPFHGTIKGNNHTLSGLNNGTMTDVGDITITSTTKSFGSAYGLIAWAGNGSVSVSDLTMADVNIDMKDGDKVGAVLGFAASHDKFGNEYASNTACEDVLVENITVTGKINAKQDVGGVCGKLYNSGKVTIKNCTNKADLTANFINSSDNPKPDDDATGRASGIASFISNPTDVEITGCKNEGKVTAYMYVSGIASFAFDPQISEHITITNCANSGDIVRKTAKKDSEMRAGYILSLGGKEFNVSATGSSYNFSGNTNTGKMYDANGNELTTETNKVFLIRILYSQDAEANNTNATKK